MQKRLAEQADELHQAMEQIETLRDILPICSFCKKIRNDKRVWKRIEEYISRHSRAEFSHTICTGCIQKHYPEYDDVETISV